MSAEYKLIVRAPDGTKRTEIGDMDWLTCQRRVNEPGVLAFGLRGNHPKLGALENFGQVELLRRYPRYGIDWYPEFYGLYRDDEQTQTRVHRFEAKCYGQLSMLGWRHVAYKANTANKTIFTGVKAATIMWELVRTNATSIATTFNGRMLAGAITGLSAGSDPNSGPAINWACAWSNLLAELQKLAPVAGGDFDLVKTGPQAWAWTFYPGQRGTDRSSTVLFSLDRGNITNVRYQRERVRARTAAIVAGPGEDDARTVRIRYGSDYSAANHIETFVDARNLGESVTNQALDNRGDQALEAARQRNVLGFEVIQVESCLYGKHYFLGDLVGYRSFDAEGTTKVQGVALAYRRAERFEQIGVELRDV